MNLQRFGLKSIEELVFLYSLDIPLDIHKSQFEAFAKAMYEQGYFQLKTTNHSFVDEFLSNKKLKIVPFKHIYFNRIIDARTIAKYQWGVSDLQPTKASKPYHPEFFIKPKNGTITGRRQGKTAVNSLLQEYITKKQLQQSLRNTIIYGSSINKVFFDDPIT